MIFNAAFLKHVLHVNYLPHLIQMYSKEMPSQLRTLKPSPSTKKMSISDFTTKLLSKLLRDLSKEVHLKVVLMTLLPNFLVNLLMM